MENSLFRQLMVPQFVRIHASLSIVTLTGGGRLTTAMLYLSTVESGGFTIFPKLGLFFKPQAGSLLFWKLRRMDGSSDAR